MFHVLGGDELEIRWEPDELKTRVRIPFVSAIRKARYVRKTTYYPDAWTE